MDNPILDYQEAIEDGTVTVGKWVRLFYAWITAGLLSGKFRYNAKKASRAVRFIETFMHHSEGRDDLLTLELWQKALISVIFGIVDANGNRQFREVLLVVGRKNGKSLLAAAIIACALFIDGEYGAKIYCVAPKLGQADLVFSAFWQSIQKEPELAEMMRSRKTDLYLAETNSSVTKIAFNSKKSDGYNPHVTVCDEIASWPGEKGLKQYAVMTSAGGARRQPITLSCTTSGYENEGIYDDLMKRSTRVLMGTSAETRLAPILYMIDDLSKWDDMTELRKANPNMGVSISEEYLQEQIRIAYGSLTAKAEFIVKHCNIKQSSAQAWLSASEIEGTCSEALTLNQFRHCYCVGGIDLSRTTDLTACVIVIEKAGKLYTIAHFFLPRNKLQEASDRDELPYSTFVERGWLTLSGDNFVNYRDCYDWFVKLIREYQIYPLKIGYDRYSSQYLVQDMQTYGFHMDDVHQGYNLTPVIHEVEGLVKDQVICIGDNDLLKVHLCNSALQKDSQTGRCKLIKIQNTDRIDGCAALLDAMTVRQKWYSVIGSQLKNAG